MNPEWNEAVAHKYVIHVRSKNKYPESTPPPNPTHSGSRHMGSKSYWKESGSNRSSPGNHSALYADNDFMKKSRMLTDIVNPPVRHHSYTTVIVIASIFMFVTMAITASIVVFCRKRNSIFALQKSEQEDDGEYELDELTTDVEYTETDIESEYDNISRRKSYPPDASEDPSHRLLGVPGLGRGNVHDPIHGAHKCCCQHAIYLRNVKIKQDAYANRGSYDKRGAYRNMVVSILEKHHGNSDNDDSEAEEHHAGWKSRSEDYQVICSHDADSDDSDHELLNTANIAPGDNYECVHCRESNTNNNCSTSSERRKMHKKSCHGCGVTKNGTCENGQTMKGEDESMMKNYSEGPYVDLPPERKSDLDNSCYVNLPAKHGMDEHIGLEDGHMVDLHPRKMSDSQYLHCKLSYFEHSTIDRQLHHCNVTSTKYTHDVRDVLGSRSSVRSHSVSENLAHLATSHSTYGTQSCPQTPLAEDMSHMGIYNPHTFQNSHSDRYQNPDSVGAVTYNSGIWLDRLQHSDMNSSLSVDTGSSTSSVDRDAPVSFLLSNPYSSDMSLAKDGHYPISEVGTTSTTKPRTLRGVSPCFTQDNSRTPVSTANVDFEECSGTQPSISAISESHNVRTCDLNSNRVLLAKVDLRECSGTQQPFTSAISDSHNVRPRDLTSNLSERLSPNLDLVSSHDDGLNITDYGSIVVSDTDSEGSNYHTVCTDNEYDG